MQQSQQATSHRGSRQAVQRQRANKLKQSKDNRQAAQRQDANNPIYKQSSSRTSVYRTAKIQSASLTQQVQMLSISFDDSYTKGHTWFVRVQAQSHTSTKSEFNWWCKTKTKTMRRESKSCLKTLKTKTKTQTKKKPMHTGKDQGKNNEMIS